MEKFSLKCLGTADGYPSAERSHSAYLYRLGGECLLVDCGEPATRQLLRAKVGADEIDRIFISHLHFDHAGGLFMLIQAFWLQGRTKALRIHLPGYSIAPIRQMLNAAYVFDEMVPFQLSFEALSPGLSIPAGGAQVTPHLTTHLENCRKSYQSKYPQPFEAFSFVLESAGVRIGHSADIGAVGDIEPLLGKPLDLLVCELAHVQPEELFVHLRDRNLKRILFVHVARSHWENLERLQELAARVLQTIPFAFARDGDEIPLT